MGLACGGDGCAVPVNSLTLELFLLLFFVFTLFFRCLFTGSFVLYRFILTLIRT